MRGIRTCHHFAVTKDLTIKTSIVRFAQTQAQTQAQVQTQAQAQTQVQTRAQAQFFGSEHSTHTPQTSIRIIAMKKVTVMER